MNDIDSINLEIQNLIDSWARQQEQLDHLELLMKIQNDVNLERERNETHIADIMDIQLKNDKQQAEAIADLQQKMQIYEGATIAYNWDYDRMRTIQNVLKELLYFFATKDVNWSYKDPTAIKDDMHELIEKLDGPSPVKDPIIDYEKDLEEIESIMPDLPWEMDKCEDDEEEIDLNQFNPVAELLGVNPCRNTIKNIIADLKALPYGSGIEEEIHRLVLKYEGMIK